MNNYLSINSHNAGLSSQNEHEGLPESFLKLQHTHSFIKMLPTYPLPERRGFDMLEKYLLRGYDTGLVNRWLCNSLYSDLTLTEKLMESIYQSVSTFEEKKLDTPAAHNYFGTQLVKWIAAHTLPSNELRRKILKYSFKLQREYYKKREQKSFKFNCLAVGVNPLIQAIQKTDDYNIQIAQLLNEQPWLATQADNNGNTPLHHAVKTKSLLLIWRLCCIQGVDPSVHNNAGVTPAQWWTSDENRQITDSDEAILCHRLIERHSTDNAKTVIYLDKICQIRPHLIQAKSNTDFAKFYDDIPILCALTYVVCEQALQQFKNMQQESHEQTSIECHRLLNCLLDLNLKNSYQNNMFAQKIQSIRDYIYMLVHNEKERKRAISLAKLMPGMNAVSSCDVYTITIDLAKLDNFFDALTTIIHEISHLMSFTYDLTIDNDYKTLADLNALAHQGLSQLNTTSLTKIEENHEITAMEQKILILSAPHIATTALLESCQDGQTQLTIPQWMALNNAETIAWAIIGLSAISQGYAELNNTKSKLLIQPEFLSETYFRNLDEHQLSNMQIQLFSAGKPVEPKSPTQTPKSITGPSQDYTPPTTDSSHSCNHTRLSQQMGAFNGHKTDPVPVQPFSQQSMASLCTNPGLTNHNC